VLRLKDKQLFRKLKEIMTIITEMKNTVNSGIDSDILEIIQSESL
jgi:hypothetical protein